jgi:hypothetical protein
MSDNIKLNTKIDYDHILSYLVKNKNPFDDQHEKITEQQKRGIFQKLLKSDLYFLMVYGLNKKFLKTQYIYDLCQEIQDDCDNVMNLWARGHLKSTLITFGNTIRRLLNRPDTTACIFSFNNATAKDFFLEIKNEFVNNDFLRWCFPDIIPNANCNGTKKNPGKLNEDIIILKRESRRKEPTLMYSGLVDSMPTSKHFDLMIYDDVVTPESVNTKEMIEKTTQRFNLSGALSSTMSHTERWICGTRYHFADTYNELIVENRVDKIRLITPFRKTEILPPFTDKKILEAIKTTSEDYKADPKDEDLLLFTNENYKYWYKLLGSTNFMCQMFQNPSDPSKKVFDVGKIRYGKPDIDLEKAMFRRLIIVDPAISEKKKSDLFVILVYDEYVYNKEKYIHIPYYWAKQGGNRNPSKMVEKLVEVCKNFNYNKPIIETIQYQKALKFRIRELAGPGSEFPLMPKENKVQHKNKREKIMSIEPYLDCARLYVEKHMDDLVMQLDMFPAGHDDIIECIGIGIQHGQIGLGKRGTPKNNVDRFKNLGYDKLNWNKKRKVGRDDVVIRG